MKNLINTTRLQYFEGRETILIVFIAIPALAVCLSILIYHPFNIIDPLIISMTSVLLFLIFFVLYYYIHPTNGFKVGSSPRSLSLLNSMRYEDLDIPKEINTSYFKENGKGIKIIIVNPTDKKLTYLHRYDIRIVKKIKDNLYHGFLSIHLSDSPWHQEDYEIYTDMLDYIKFNKDDIYNIIQDKNNEATKSMIEHQLLLDKKIPDPYHDMSVSMQIEIKQHINGILKRLEKEGKVGYFYNDPVYKTI